MQASACVKTFIQHVRRWELVHQETCKKKKFGTTCSQPVFSVAPRTDTAGHSVRCAVQEGQSFTALQAE